jgi:phosphomethylpyrimidine synthase
MSSDPITQLEHARNGDITPEMRYVAEREQLEPDLIRSEVAAGRMVIPANKAHLAGRLEPMCIGIAARCKVNANIGNSAVTSSLDGEIDKLHYAVHYGADTGPIGWAHRRAARMPVADVHSGDHLPTAVV